MSDPSTEPRLKHFPVAFFAMIMGLTGVSIAWHKAELVFALPLAISDAVLTIAVLAFAALSVLYLNKLIRFRQMVLKELAHPIQLNFFPTISISLILLGIAFLPRSPGSAGVLWVLGASLHLLLTLYVMGVWIHQEHFEIHHINPAWFILALIGWVLLSFVTLVVVYLLYRTARAASGGKICAPAQ